MPDALTARARWAALVVVCFAQFMVVLDATIVNVALPVDPDRPQPQHRAAAVDRQRLHADVRRLPAPRRPRGRPHRPPQAVPDRHRALQRGVGRQRSRQHGRGADHRAWRAGPRRRAGLPRGAVDHHHHLRRGQGPHPRDGRLGRDRRRRRRLRPAPRRHPDRRPQLAVDLRHQRPHRDRHRDRRAALGPRVARRHDPPALRPRGRGDRHRGPDRARLRHRHDAGAGLGVAAHARPQRRRRRAPGRLRGHRAPLGGAARAPRDLPHTHAGDRQRHPLHRRRRPLRDVLLRHALRPADPRLLAAAGRLRVPARDLRDHRRRRALAAADPAHRRQADRPDRADARRGGPRRARGDDQGRRLLPGHPLRPRADVDRHGQHVRAADAGGDDGHRGRGRRPRVGPVQHLPAGGRRAGARGPLVAGRLTDVLVPERPRAARPPPTTSRPRWSRASSSRSP